MYVYCSVECRCYFSGKNARNKPGYKEKFKAYHAAWRARNKEKVRLYALRHSLRLTPEQKRANYEKIKTKHLAKAKQYYRENAERIKAKVRAYHHANKDKIKARSAAYRKAHRAELAAKQLGRYNEKKAYIKEWRKKNAVKLKEQRQKCYWNNREKYLADQRERVKRLDPQKKLERNRKYTCKQKRKKLELEFALLSGLLAKPASPTSKPLPASKPRKN